MTDLLIVDAIAVLAAPEGSANDPEWWVTSLIAVGSAILGSLAGGVASFRSNIALDDRRRRARAAVRRKAKIYTPLRAQLLDVRRGIAEDRHIRWGVSREQPDRRLSTQQTPTFFFWDELRADGRADTAAGSRVRDRIEDVLAAIDAFNAARTAALDVFQSHANRLHREVLGTEPTITNWAEHDLVHIARDREWWTLFGFSQEERAQKAQAFSDFRQRFSAEQEVQTARGSLEETERRLDGRIAEALEEIEAAMKRIADKHEREAEED